MRELFFLITLALSVAIGFAACGDDDDDKTDMPIETTVDATVAEVDIGSEAVEEETDAEVAGTDASNEEVADEPEAE